jgi:hypothetical protein
MVADSVCSLRLKTLSYAALAQRKNGAEWLRRKDVHDMFDWLRARDLNQQRQTPVFSVS